MQTEMTQYESAPKEKPKHWTLDDIDWHKFDNSLVDTQILKAVKAASLVEFNAAEYVKYLKSVFKDQPEVFPVFEKWGEEEIQHGRALARYAEMADPEFNFEAAIAKFREGFRPEQFDTGVAVRGGRAGEMIARCVVESGTSSYYTAMKEASDEPVLKQIAAKIAADEYVHYNLFYRTFHAQQKDERMSFWQKLKVAAGRVNEADDDELSYAYYCANTPIHEIGIRPYDRKECSRAYSARVQSMYRKQHIFRLMQMIAKAIGANPQGFLPKIASFFVWGYIRYQANKELAA